MNEKLNELSSPRTSQGCTSQNHWRQSSNSSNSSCSSELGERLAVLGTQCQQLINSSIPTANYQVTGEKNVYRKCGQTHQKNTPENIYYMRTKKNRHHEPRCSQNHLVLNKLPYFLKEVKITTLLNENLFHRTMLPYESIKKFFFYYRQNVSFCSRS